MDPRERAEAILARARARGAFVVTPDSAISPMDATNTIQIPRMVVRDADRDPEVTSVFPVTDELPAIAQEAATQSLASPPRPTERLPRQAPPPRPEQVDGILPTTTQPGSDRSNLSRRLDGGF